MPHDLALGDVYIPPLLAAAVVALITSRYTARFMVTRGIMEHFANPPLVFVALSILYTLLFGATLFPT